MFCMNTFSHFYFYSRFGNILVCNEMVLYMNFSLRVSFVLKRF